MTKNIQRILYVESQYKFIGPSYRNFIYMTNSMHANKDSLDTLQRLNSGVSGVSGVSNSGQPFRFSGIPIGYRKTDNRNASSLPDLVTTPEKTPSPSRLSRRAILLAVVLVAMRVCHRSLRRLARVADKLRV